MLHRADLWAIPFSLLWGGFAIFWEWLALSMGGPVFLAFWGIPFVLFGLYLIAGRFWFDARRRSQTRYALTSERVLIASGPGFRRVQSVPLRQLSDVELDEQADGSGSITLGRANAGPWSLIGWRTGLMPPSWPGVPKGAPQLEGVADAQRVVQRIREAQQRAR